MVFSSSILLIVIYCVVCSSECVTELECLQLLASRESLNIGLQPIDFVNSIALYIICIVVIVYIVIRLRRLRKTSDLESDSVDNSLQQELLNP